MSTRPYCGKHGVNFDPAEGCGECQLQSSLAPAPGYPPLTDFQSRKLAMLRKGYGISATRRGWKAQEWREMQELVARGLVRITPPASWNKAGSFVAADNEKVSEVAGRKDQDANT